METANEKTAAEGVSPRRLVIVDEDHNIVEMSPDVEVIYLGYLNLPGEWERLSEEGREYVRGRWPKFVPGPVTPRVSDLVGGGSTGVSASGEVTPGVVSITAPVERNVSVLFCPVGGIRNLQGLSEAERERYGEQITTDFAYVRLTAGAGGDGVERLLDDCEREIARRSPGGPWTLPDGRVWGDVVIGNAMGIVVASAVAGGLGSAGVGSVQ